MPTNKLNRLKDLQLYLTLEHSTAVDRATMVGIEGIASRTVEAIDAGATTDEIKDIFARYVPKYSEKQTQTSP